MVHSMNVINLPDDVTQSFGELLTAGWYLPEGLHYSPPVQQMASLQHLSFADGSSLSHL